MELSPLVTYNCTPIPHPTPIFSCKLAWRKYYCWSTVLHVHSIFLYMVFDFQSLPVIDFLLLFFCLYGLLMESMIFEKGTEQMTK